MTFELFGNATNNNELLPDGRPRLPPGQRLVENWPILHYGSIPRIDLATWQFQIGGLVQQELSFSWDDFMSLPQVDVRTDIHCVTTWSKYDNDWVGIQFSEILKIANPLPEAKYVIFHSYGGYTTNLAISELDRPDVLLVHTHNGEPLTPEHGAPLRGMVPHLYFWKSAKWVSGIEFVAQDRPGFWELYGYHMHGDPWIEERYG